jgi:hypothetical protein
MLRNNKNIYSAAAIGTLIGAGVATLFTTKLGSCLLEKLNENIGEAQEKGSKYAHQLFKKESPSFFGDKAAHILEESREYVNLNLITGAVGGALLGAIAAAYLAENDEKEKFFATNIKEAASNTVQNLKSFDWLETAHHIADALTAKTCDAVDKIAKENKKSSGIDDFIEVATLAYRLFQK